MTCEHTARTVIKSYRPCAHPAHRQSSSSIGPALRVAVRSFSLASRIAIKSKSIPGLVPTTAVRRRGRERT